MGLFPSLHTFSQVSFAPLDDNRYSIAKGAGGSIASDLMWQGKKISAPEIVELTELSWSGKIDLSTLDPAPQDEIWNPQLINQPDQIQETDLPTHLEVDFQDMAISSTGSDRDSTIKFAASGKTLSGKKTLFHIMLSDNAHKILMRSEIIKKLGYRHTFMKRTALVKVNFLNQEAKEQFLSDLDYYSSDAPKKWLVESKNSNTSVLLQDSIIMLADDFTKPNFAFNPPLLEEIQDQRALRALAIIHNLLPITSSSLNLLRWYAGSIFSGNVILEDPSTFLFGATYEDARWIIRLLNQLQESDFIDVVKKSDLPPCVQKLYLEKIKSRVKSLGELFDLPNDHLKTSELVRCGQDVVDGKLTVDTFEGYAPSFAFGDPENPLTMKEILNIVWSKLYETGFNTLNNYINNLPIMGTAVDAKNQLKYNELRATAIAQSQAEGKTISIPTTTWSFPTYKAQIYINRFVTAGPYQGTTNRLSQADVFGISGSIGEYMGIAGLLPDFKDNKNSKIKSPFNALTADLEANITFSHISPINRISDAVKNITRFKEVLAPVEQHKTVNLLNSILKKKDDETITEEDLNAFNDSFQEGESFIVNFKIAPKISTNFKFIFYQWISLTTQFGIEDDGFYRLHFYRKNKNNIQIYQSFANDFIPVKFNAGLSLFIPLARFSQRNHFGNGNTNFYQVSLNQADKQWKKNFLALKQAVKWGNLNKLKSLQKPYVIKFKTAESTSSVGLLFFSWNRLKQNNSLTITNPSGSKRDFTRFELSRLSGQNIYEYSADVVDELASTLLKFNPKLNSYSFNPGWSITGRAKGQSVTLETETTEGVEWRPFAKITRFFNGFQVKRKRADRILKEIADHYHYQFFPESILYNVKKLILYSFVINSYVYPEAIEHVLAVSPEIAKNQFLKYSNDHDFNEFYVKSENSPNHNSRLAGRFEYLRKKTIRFKVKKNLKKYNKFLAKTLSHVEEKLQLTGQVHLYGDATNFYIEPRILGFRTGQEYSPTDANDGSLSGSAFGIGQRKNYGPLSALMYSPDERIDISEGELFLSWMLTRAF